MEFTTTTSISTKTGINNRQTVTPQPGTNVPEEVTNDVTDAVTSSESLLDSSLEARNKQKLAEQLCNEGETFLLRRDFLNAKEKLNAAIELGSNKAEYLRGKLDIQEQQCHPANYSTATKLFCSADRKGYASATVELVSEYRCRQELAQHSTPSFNSVKKAFNVKKSEILLCFDPYNSAQDSDLRTGTSLIQEAAKQGHLEAAKWMVEKLQDLILSEKENKAFPLEHYEKELVFYFELVSAGHQNAWGIADWIANKLRDLILSDKKIQAFSSEGYKNSLVSYLEKIGEKKTSSQWFDLGQLYSERAERSANKLIDFKLELKIDYCFNQAIKLIKKQDDASNVRQSAALLMGMRCAARPFSWSLEKPLVSPEELANDYFKIASEYAKKPAKELERLQKVSGELRKLVDMDLQDVKKLVDLQIQGALWFYVKKHYLTMPKNQTNIDVQQLVDRWPITYSRRQEILSDCLKVQIQHAKACLTGEGQLQDEKQGLHFLESVINSGENEKSRETLFFVTNWYEKSYKKEGAKGEKKFADETKYLYYAAIFCKKYNKDNAYNIGAVYESRYRKSGDKTAEKLAIDFYQIGANGTRAKDALARLNTKIDPEAAEKAMAAIPDKADLSSQLV